MRPTALTAIQRAALFLLVSASTGQSEDRSSGEGAPRADRVDYYGDPLPAGATARLGTIRYRNPGWYKRVKFLSGTHTIAVGTPGESLRFGDAASGKLTREMTFGDAYLQAFDVSADGASFATLSTLRLGDSREYNVHVELWDAASGERKSIMQWIEPVGEASRRVAFSPDGKLIVTATRHGWLKFRDVASGDELLTAQVLERGEVDEIAFSPDGEWVAAASRQGVYLWDWLTAKKPQKLDGLERGAMSVVFSPDGKWLATGSNDAVGGRLYDVATAKLVRRLTGDAGHYYAEGVAFDPAGRLLAVPAYDAGVEVWNTGSGELVNTLPADRLEMRDVAISSDGQYVVGVSGESVIRVWDLETSEALGEGFVGHNEQPYEIAFTPDGTRVVSGDTSGLIRVWDAHTGQPHHAMGHEGWVAALVVSPDGRQVVSSGHDESIRVWETDTGNEVYDLIGHGRLGGKYKLGFAADGQTFASLGPDMYLRTWSMQSGKALAEHPIRPRGMAFEVDEDGNPVTGRDPFGGMGPVEATRNSRFSADGKLLLLPHGGDIHVFDVQSGELVRRFAPGGAAFERFALSPDGKWLVTISSQRPQDRNQLTTTDLRIVDFATNEVALHRVLDGRYSREFHFSPDGSLWAMCGVGAGANRDEWTSLWSIESREEVARVPRQGSAVAFSYDNNQLAMSQTDTSILVWDLASFRNDDD